MSAPIVTGLLAYGMSGRVFHAPFLSTNPQFKLKAVVERNQKKMAAHYPDIVSYNSVEEILADSEIELIIVNTPNFTHFDFAKQALKAGKHVLIEKPAAGNVAGIKELFDTARSIDRQVFCYQNRRWDSDFLSVKGVIESGRLGKLTEVSLRYDRYKPQLNPKPFKETKETPINGIVYELGPHLIDQAIHLFGRPLAFDKLTAIQRENSEVPDYVNYRLTYPAGLIVYLTSGLLIADPLPAFVVHGSVGSYSKYRCDVQEAQLDKGILPTDDAYGIEPVGMEGKLVTVGADGEKSIEFIPAVKGDYSNLFYAVYHAIRENALYPITEEHMAWQMELLEA
ncbi:Gfo/Idh/MocA family oxidoreductase [Mucilaginibacter sp. UR6-11]|uniref:Gfo/Idh/MocA family oxidoreductase n=1 Tax=Mucilaginibacter sp. UR6-11 TaxID=1435644 RepID=UPI001E4EE447|nr:Gfo/Idh/MocA family oxidoreductase [Mucilaginibacter sp. UR6-11]MCC8424703.1 Gfo/Idh/MocA family oxidoreductase [Mucilaginibacter sp. UR6-11]